MNLEACLSKRDKYKIASILVEALEGRKESTVSDLKRIHLLYSHLLGKMSEKIKIKNFLILLCRIF